MTILGTLVRTRRDALRLTCAHVHSLGGPDPATLVSIEERGDLPDDDAAVALDRALGWKPGSAAAAASSGAEPEVVRTPNPANPLVGTPRPVFAQCVASLLRSVARFDRQLHSAANALVADPAFVAAYSENAAASGAVIGEWTTMILERNRRESQPLSPCLHSSVGLFLDQATEIPDEAVLDKEERLYRKWLGHRYPDASDSEVRHFKRRLAEASSYALPQQQYRGGASGSGQIVARAARVLWPTTRGHALSSLLATAVNADTPGIELSVETAAGYLTARQPIAGQHIAAIAHSLGLPAEVLLYPRTTAASAVYADLDVMSALLEARTSLRALPD